jgi:succinyl-diaminopimelate desuccinylase
MKDEIIELTQKLIRLKSIPEHPDQLNRCLDICLNSIKATKIELFERNGSKSILAYNRNVRPDRFKIILNGHLDVIPGKPDQYEPIVKGDRLYGVGATDMKANVACIIAVFNKMADKVDYPLALQLVTDEELGGFDGTKYQIEQGVRADFVIAAESTNFDIVNQAKGVIWARVTATGKTAHGAYPWRGENAIQKMSKFISILEREYPVPKTQEWCTTVNVSSINSKNQTFNKIPDQCTLDLDIRFLPSEASDAIDRLKRIIPIDLTLEIIAHEPALYVDGHNNFLKSLKTATEAITRQSSNFYCAQGSSDARHYTRVGDAGVEFGPIGGGIGTDEEWINIPSLSDYCLILERFLA